MSATELNAAQRLDEQVAEVRRLLAESRAKIVARDEDGGKPLRELSAAHLAAYERDGFLHIPGEELWTLDEYDTMLREVDEVGSWPDKAGAYMKYYEDNLLPGHENERILCRVENFLQFNEALNGVVNGPKVNKMVAQLFGEPAVLFKEKINFKKPGADGFKPHQDHAAGWWLYGQTLHISTLVCVDPATELNGALSLVRGRNKEGLLCKEWEEIPAETCAELDWELVVTKPGDVVFFDSFVPHKSGPNPSPTTRRVLYNTFAKASEGDFRDRYYADKRRSFPPDCEREAGKEYAYKI